jgi:hypothetical protein
MTFDANNSVVREEARADLRIRLNELSEREFSDDELNHWLNLGQYDAWMQLKQITSIWYGKTGNVTLIASPGIGDGGVGPLPGDCGEIKKVLISGVFIPVIDVKDFEGFQGNNLYSSVDFCAQRGQELIVTQTASGTAVVYYIAQPAELAADGTYIQVPLEHNDLVIMFAQTKAMQKLGLTEQRQATEKDIGNRLEAIRGAYMNEMQLEEYRKNLRFQGR